MARYKKNMSGGFLIVARENPFPSSRF